MQLVRLPDTATDANADAATDFAADAKAHAAANRAADTGTYASADLRTAGLRGFKLERLFGMYAAVRRRVDGSKSHHRACKVRRDVRSGRDGRRRGCSLQPGTLSCGVCAR